jgi:hypothetical protein
MSVYTVHEPPPRTHETAADPTRFVFVRDGFHFWAFLLGPVWMLWHRLWLVFVLYLVLSGALHVGLWLTGATSATTFFVGLLVSILIGLEASTLRRWTYHRRGWATVGVVAAADAETAERRFYDSWRGHAARPRWEPPPPSGSFQAPAGRDPAVLGLFPEPGVQR